MYLGHDTVLIRGNSLGKGSLRKPSTWEHGCEEIKPGKVPPAITGQVHRVQRAGAAVTVRTELWERAEIWERGPRLSSASRGGRCARAPTPWLTAPTSGSLGLPSPRHVGGHNAQMSTSLKNLKSGKDVRNYGLTFILQGRTCSTAAVCSEGSTACLREVKASLALRTRSTLIVLKRLGVGSEMRMCISHTVRFKHTAS